jgi:hypothetical protein
MTDFIYVDGVEYKADKELVDLIKNHANNSLSNSFERQAKDADYYYIGQDGVVYKVTEANISFDDRRYKIGNYCLNEELLKKRAAEEILLRKMWRFSLTHDGDKIDWNNEDTQKWYLSYTLEGIVISYVCLLRQIGVIYFNSKEVAEEAKKEFEKEFKEVYGITNN